MQGYVQSLTAAHFKLVLTVVGLDSTYQADISASMTYGPGDLLWNKRFASVMSRDDRTGRPFVNFSALSDVIDVDKSVLALDSTSFSEPEVRQDVVYLCIGCWHRHDGDPLLHVCSFCARVRWLLEEAGVKYETLRINLREKPEWFVIKNRGGMTPFAAIGGEWISDSLEIVDALRKHYPSVSAITSRTCSLPPEVLDGSTLRAGFEAVLSTMPGSDEAEEILENWIDGPLAVVNTHLIFNGPFLCGEQLGRSDILLGSMLAELLLKARVWYDLDASPSRLLYYCISATF